MKLRWREIIISLLMAFVLWYGVTGSEKMESQVDVRVDYRGLPQGLVVRSGFVNKVQVRVRAPVAQLRSITSRDYAFPIDLSGVRKGENTLAIDLAYLPFRSGVEVIEVSPSRLYLEVDSQESKYVPLAAKIQGELPKDLAVRTVFDPPQVNISGPAALLDALEQISVPVTIDAPAIPGVSEVKRVLSVPEGVDVSPPEVKVSVHVGLKRKQIKVTRTVHVNAPSSLGKFVRPDKVSITLYVPESLAGKAASSSDIRAHVELPGHNLGSYTLPVRVSLPEGAELMGIDPQRVTVTLEQKQTPPPKKK